MSPELDRISRIREAKTNVNNIRGMLVRAKEVMKHCREDLKEACNHFEKVVEDNMVDDEVSSPLLAYGNRDKALDAIGTAPVEVAENDGDYSSWPEIEITSVETISPQCRAILIENGFHSVGVIFEWHEEGHCLADIDEMTDVMASEVEVAIQAILTTCEPGLILKLRVFPSPSGSRVVDELVDGSDLPEPETEVAADSDSANGVDDSPVISDTPVTPKRSKKLTAKKTEVLQDAAF